MRKSAYLFLLAAVGSLTASAQEKLKDVQENGLWASTIKVDGKLPELNNTFQAYNKTLKVFYTISNDSKAIYLQLKSSDPTTTAKIQAGGITFALNTANKKKEDDAFTVTYPVIARPQRGQRGAGGFGGGAGGARGGAGGMGGFAGLMGGDSAQVKEAQQRFITSSKEIKVAGFKDISDSLVSVYNEYGIKAAMNFEADGSFTYEVAVPLKQLGLTTADGKEIAYNLKLNGLQIGGRGGFGGGPGGGGVDVVVGGGPGGGGGGFGGGGGRGGGGGGGARGGFGGGGARPGGNRPGANINFAELASATDFWGKYKLAKQQ